MSGKIVKSMGTRKQRRTVYGKSAHYWPVKMQPFLVAAACVEVVLKNSEKANIIYCEAKEAWGRQDCQQALNDVKIPFSSMLSAIEAVRSNKLSDSPDPLADIKERYKESMDFKYLIERVNEFIKVGFNREADKVKGRYKVRPSQDNWLFYAVFIGTMDKRILLRRAYSTLALTSELTMEFCSVVFFPQIKRRLVHLQVTSLIKVVVILTSIIVERSL